MDLKFVEAGHGSMGGNWGKFAFGRYTSPELCEPTLFPGCEGQRIVSLRGNGRDHVWMLDLATGEGVRFALSSYRADEILRSHKVHVCPLFEPTLSWFLTHLMLHPKTWWEDLPRSVLLPSAPFAFSGYRRGGDER